MFYLVLYNEQLYFDIRNSKLNNIKIVQFGFDLMIFLCLTLMYVCLGLSTEGNVVSNLFFISHTSLENWEWQS